MSASDRFLEVLYLKYSVSSAIGIGHTKFWESPMDNTSRVYCFGLVLDSPFWQLEMGFLFYSLLPWGGALLP